MNFHETTELLRGIVKTKLGTCGSLFIEDNGFQRIYVEYLDDIHEKVKGVKTHGDKKQRLTLTGPAIKDSSILFPRHGCEQLLAQITRFGEEKHDDLADAFSMLILQIIEDDDLYYDAMPMWT